MRLLRINVPFYDPRGCMGVAPFVQALLCVYKLVSTILDISCVAGIN